MNERFNKSINSNKMSDVNEYADDNKSDLNEDYITAHQRLIEELLDPAFYEKKVHPKRNFNQPTQVNLSMSLYQILEVVNFYL